MIISHHHSHPPNSPLFLLIDPHPKFMSLLFDTQQSTVIYAYVCSSVGTIHCTVGNLVKGKVKARKQKTSLWGGHMLGCK